MNLTDQPTPVSDAETFPAFQATRFHYGEDLLVDADVAKKLEQLARAWREVAELAANELRETAWLWGESPPSDQYKAVLEAFDNLKSKADEHI